MRAVRFTLSISALILCLFMAACNDDKEKQSSFTSEKSSETEKWNAYVSLSNESNSFIDNAAFYFSIFGTGVEPEVDSSRVDKFIHNMQARYRVMERIGATSSASAVAQAEKLPQSDLDKKALAFANSVKALWECFREVHGYYEAKSYADDKLAKGKLLHSRMLAIFAELQPAYKNFSIAMTDQNRKNMLRDAKQMRVEGMRVVPAALEFMVAARAASAEMERQQLTEDTVYKLDATAFKPYYDDLVKALAEMEAAGADKAQIEKEKLYEDRVESVVSYAKKIKASATSIQELAAKGEPKKDVPIWERPQPSIMNSPKNTPKDFDWLLDQMVGVYNTTIGTRKQR